MNRVQLSRRKGWRMPAGTKKVDRTTPWGNPFGHLSTRAEQVAAFDAWAWMPEQKKYRGRVRAELAGWRLACWCPLEGGPCHANTLLRIAAGAAKGGEGRATRG